MTNISHIFIPIFLINPLKFYFEKYINAGLCKKKALKY